MKKSYTTRPSLMPQHHVPRSAGHADNKKLRHTCIGDSGEAKQIMRPKGATFDAVTLLETVLAIGILVIAFTGIIGLSLGGLIGSVRGSERFEATALANEALEASRSIRDFEWGNLAAGTHGLSDAAGYWAFSGSSNTIGRFTRMVTVTDVDTITKEVTAHVQWQTFAGVATAIEMTNRFTNRLNPLWTQTLEADFNGGSRNSTRVTAVSDGEVQLENGTNFVNGAVYATHDFSGGGDVTDIAGVGNTIYVVTANDGSGKELLSIDISNVSNGVMSDLNSLELGTQANKIVIGGGYAYIATNNKTEEVMIVRLSDFTKVNSINVSGSEDAYGLFLSGTSLYVTRKKSSGDEFLAYNISAPESPIASQLGSVELDADVNDVVISGNYAYVATSNNELRIIRLSTYTVVNSVDFPGTADAIVVRVSGNTAYVGRESGNPDAEFYSLNVSSPEGTIITNGSIDLGTDESIIDMALSGTTVYVGTERDGGAQDKKVAIIDAVNNTLTGWIDFADSENAHSKAVWMQGSYIYVGSSHNTETIQVVKGSEVANQYVTNGTLISTAFDTGVTNPTYGSLSWTQGGGGTIRFQLRTAATQAGLATAVWVGPDGTSGTFYTLSGTTIITQSGAAKRWIQYQAELSGSGSATPILNDLNIAYAL